MVSAGQTQIVHDKAFAMVHPCELYLDHGSAQPSLTQGHHRHPQYLQERLWGEVRDQTLLWVCGTCHDNIHEWLYWLLGEHRRPQPDPPPRAKHEAQMAFEWYQANQPAAESNPSLF